MKDVTSDTYLGYVISADEKNKKNIKSSVFKGLGMVSQIMNLRDIVNFGENCLELLSDTMLINQKLKSLKT